MSLTLITLTLLTITAQKPATVNPVFNELVDKGIKLSDGEVIKLRKPIMPDGLDADGQRAAMDRVARPRASRADLVQKSFFAPVVTDVRTPRKSEDEGPSVRSVDIWFVAHGNWDVLTSKDFVESAMKTEEGKSQVLLKSGALDAKALAARKLKVTNRDDYEERFVYSTVNLFDLVRVSATRFAVATKGKESMLAAGRLDPRFANDVDYPNQWRPLVRDAEANIVPGKPHPFKHAGGYAKITRLKSPADGVFVECHVIYEEDYGWFDGINLVKQKLPAMVQEKVRVFRRKLITASEKGGKPGKP
ncbi:MAG: hypothetical protein ABFC96_14260 [Thermoguttaceae bacterium]